ncbi:penicillin-binding protein, beta-lactamase class C [Mycolicibacterium rhodesiae NBB3]|uniref:Penicillin-binding protein, beta-lactamase class C n=1 Tax=Mycolicibacterium rhodesiae (strain NBB3) TaxID=710685 RepID=G8RYI6_MYCRN|nr:serine hydrolase [Mycolicibacterium rhodesiae]AEV73265.1 penicillin-binding protein, beta-lactamase class C [Mycolicibacterium rhodesiae NBB3]
MNALARLAVVGLIAVVPGCTADKPAEQAPPSTPTQADVPPPLVPAMPLPENAVDKAVAKLDGIAEDLMSKSGIPGMAVAVVHRGKTVYAKGFGVKDVKTGEKIDVDTVFQLASLSKPLTSTVVAHQVGVNAIGWDTPVVSKLPWFALSDPVVTKMVTVGDMLSHRSGLPDHAGDMLEDLGHDRRYVLEHLRDFPLDPFRISYAYTNYGYTTGAEAVAASAGKPWDVLADDVLFDPLGMPSTSYRFADYESRADRAIGHIHVDGKYEPLYVRDADPQAPAGGVSSSVNDMTRWLAMVLANGKHDDKQIVGADALLPALTPQILSSPPSEPAMRSGFYGYGFNVGTTSAARTSLSHSGAFELGAGTNFVILPSADIAIVALTNATPSGVAEALTAQFADLVQFGEVREDWWELYRAVFAEMEKPVGSLVGKQPPPNPSPAAALASYVGTYNNDFWGPARVTEKDGGLMLSLGTKLNVPLDHWDSNVFTFEFVTENAPPGTISKATFDGNKLTLEYYDEFGKGTFTR